MTAPEEGGTRAFYDEGVQHERDRVVSLLTERAKGWENGNWLVPAEPKVAEVLWGLAHDVGCACEDSTVGHLNDYRQGFSMPSVEQPETGARHNHDPIGHYPHCRGCGTYFCKKCNAYGDHASDEPHPRSTSDRGGA